MLPGNKRVSLEWSAPPDVLAQVVRSRKGAKPVVVFTGASEHLTDHRLHNGRRYRYVVTLIDQAGNQLGGRGKRGADQLAAAASGTRRAHS